MSAWLGGSSASRFRRSRIVASLVLALLAAAIVADHVGAYDEDYAYVRSVVGMRVPPPGTPPLFRQIMQPTAWVAACDALVLLGCAGAMMFGAGTIALWRARHAPPADFERAKRWVRWGALTTLVLFALGYTMVGGEWFGRDWDGRVDLKFLVGVAGALSYAVLPEEESE